MCQEIIHVYLMPGMAASPKIFEHIKLPENQFKIHYLEWIIPVDKESISEYALRLSKGIKHDNIVLLGVSFGGVLVQEINKHIKVRKLIIVSSVKSMHELPKRMLITKLTKAYKLVPTQLASNIDAFAKYAFGSNVNKRLELYKKYLSVRGTKYLKWSIHNVLHWSQEKSLTDIIHIHGTEDHVFPYKNIKNPIKIEEGTHVMILTKAKKISQIIHESLT